MWSGVAAFFTGLFSSDRMQSVAIDGLRKIGGLDEMNPREKAEYILNYISATKHQSPVRRFIALLLTVLYALVIVLWLTSAVIGYTYDITSALELAGAVKMFMNDVVVQPFNIILSFYFVTQIASKFGSN